MNFSGIFKQAVEITFGRRWLWLPAFLFALAVDLPRLLAAPFTPDPTQINLGQLEKLILNLGAVTENLPRVIGAIFLFSIILGGLWCLATIGQAVLIDGVRSIYQNTAVERIVHWQIGRKLLGRFVAIDTIVLFPLFVNLLAILLLLIGMSGSLLLTVQSGSTLQISPIVGVLGLLVFPLLCLIIPLGIFAYVYRLLAFRLAAFDDLPVRESIKQTRQFVKQNLAPILGWLLFTGAISYAVNGALLAGVGGIRWLIENRFAGGVGLTFELGVVVISLVVATFRNLFVSAWWTLGMLGLENKKAPAE